jgi:DNA-binding SARP family transcriptional activator
MKLVKTFRLEESMIDELQKIADQSHGGNATSALEEIINQAVSIRNIDEDIRWQMYNAYQRATSQDGNDRAARNVVDALNI